MKSQIPKKLVPNSYKHEASIIAQRLWEYLSPARNVVILCIGSDRVLGDSLGPLVGQLLTHFYDAPCFVYGSLTNPVTALNLAKIHHELKQKHPAEQIIAVDACVGIADDVGKTRVRPYGLRAGLASGKNFPKIGDVSIVATTSQHPPGSPQFSSVRLGQIYSQANEIAQGISQYLRTASQSQAKQPLYLRTLPQL